MPFQPPSKEDQERIAASVESVVSLVESGQDPTKALVKVARDRNLPAGHVDLVAKLYNLSSAEAHRKTASSLDQCLEEYPIADAEAALGQLYPEGEKTAGARRRMLVVSDEYKRPPEFVDALEKTAELDAKWAAWKPDRVPAKPANANDGLTRDWTEVRDWQLKVSASKTDCHRAYARVTGLVGQLSRDLQHPNAPALAKFANDCRIRYGALGEGLLRKAVAETPGLEKAAARRHPPVRVSDAATRTMADLVSASEDFLRLTDDHEELEKKAQARIPAVLGKYVEGWKAPAAGSLLDPPPEKTAFFLGGLFGTTIGTSLGRQLGENIVKPTEALEGKMTQKLLDPQHESKLRNINTQSMLSDLLANDEVISGYDPSEVMNHFNEISQLAPRLADQPAVMKAMLRKRLQQGALDPYEADLLTKMENNMKRNQEPSGVGYGTQPAM